MISRAAVLLKRGCLASRPSCLAISDKREWMMQKCLSFGTTDGGSGGDDENPKPSKVDNDDEDVFGVNYEDGDDKLGPSSMLPPKFKRDATTGRQIDVVENEISARDMEMLKKSQNPDTADLYLQQQVNKHWDKLDGYDEDGEKSEDTKTHWAAEMGRHVRQADMGLNVLGRSTKAQGTSEVNRDSGRDIQKDETGFSQRLTKDEFASFQEYMKARHNVDVSEEDMPVMEHQKEPEVNRSTEPLDNPHMGDWKRRLQDHSPDDTELANKWTTVLAQRQMEDANLDDNPYADLMPSDLSISRLVNRKKARRIPRELLHHNNVPLLQTFLSPTSQIQHRIHSRLGARDQRKIAKLVKRARHMGLIPHQGQFTSEQHGWIHAPDLHETRDWEKELEDRGLTIQHKPAEDDDPSQLKEQDHATSSQ